MRRRTREEEETWREKDVEENGRRSMVCGQERWSKVRRDMEGAKARSILVEDEDARGTCGFQDKTRQYLALSLRMWQCNITVDRMCVGGLCG